MRWRAQLVRIPPWAWWTAAGLLLFPVYLAYFALVLRWAGVLMFWAPAR